MAARYLALVGGDEDERRAIIERVRRSTDLIPVLDLGAVSILANPDLPIVDLGRKGVVLGTLLTPGSGGGLSALSREDCATVLGTRGRHLIDRYWGGYIAILAASDGPIQVVRAPFGWLPCLYTRAGNCWMFGSDVPLLRATGLFTPRVAPGALARHLLAGDIRHEETTLEGLSELRGGDRLTVGRDPATERLWSPWTFTDPARAIEDSAEAARRLRENAQYCVAARTSSSDRHLLLLSGGLDSSIVAACLAAAGRPFDALTLVTDNPSGDERDHARRVAGPLGVRLIEKEFRLEDVDILQSAARDLPRPTARSFEQGIQAIIARAIDAGAAGAVVGGGGGDNVFCSLQSPAPLADGLMARKGFGICRKTAHDLAELTGASVWTVVRRGWLRARSGRPYQRQPDTSFLSAKASAQADEAIDHPWLTAPRTALPGRTAHAGLLVSAQGLVEDGHVFSPLAPQSVLVSQPLIETCLRIPSWLWLDQGRNRAAARHAFAGMLPVDTLWRRSKGTPDSFLIRLLDANRPTIRDLLKDGMLAGFGLLDMPAALAAIDDPRPDRGHVFARLMQLVDAEVWARSNHG